MKSQKTKKRKCIVRDCENMSDIGSFVGDLCSPCHEFITRGNGRYSQAYRNSLRIVSAEFVRVLVDSIVQTCDPTSGRRAAGLIRFTRF